MPPTVRDRLIVGDLRAIHRPDRDLAVVVVPEHIGASVAVEIAGTLIVPIVSDRRDRLIGQDCRPIHLPEHGLAVVVAPQDVGAAVGVEVAAILEMPREIGCRDAETVDDLTCVHQPFGNRAAIVPPQHVTCAVTVEVVPVGETLLERKTARRERAVEKVADQRGGTSREVDGVEAGDAANRQQGKSITGRRTVVGRRVDARRNVEAVHGREIDTGGPDRDLDAAIGQDSGY